MKKNMMRKNLRQSIKKSIGRYIAIVAIIALGAGLFCGLRVTKKDMIATVHRYTDTQNMFDLRVMNTYGWTDDDVCALAQAEGIADAEGSISIDALLHFEGGEDSAYKLMSIPETVNRISLDTGRLPQNSDECLADGFYFDDSVIGRQVYVSSGNDETTLENLACDSYTIVGLCSTPMYLNMQRGSTTVGSGSLAAYFYLPKDGFAMDVYTEISLTLVGNYDVYTDEFDDSMDDMAEKLEDISAPLADQRRTDVLAEPEQEYADGRREYLEGVNEYETEKADALQQLADAEEELLDGEQELLDNERLLKDGRAQLNDAQKTLDKNKAQVNAGWAELEANREQIAQEIALQREDLAARQQQVQASQQQVEAGLAQLNDGIAQLDDGIAQLESGITQLESGISQTDDYIAQLESGIAQIDAALPQLDGAIAQLESEIAQIRLSLEQAKAEGSNATIEQIAQMEAQLQALTASQENHIAQRTALCAEQEGYTTQLTALQQQRPELVANLQTYTAQLTQLQLQREALLPQQQELLTNQATLTQAAKAIEDGFTQIVSAEAQANTELAAAEAELQAAQAQIASGQRQINAQWDDIASGEKALEEGLQELADGWAEYEKKKAEAYDEFEKAEQELADAEAELRDARKELDEVEPAEVYVLTRNTNIGYVVFESDSNIVAGVAKIFPAFFLAVAALVCITTMTRMVDEERTQIGTLKALGYSNFSIMWKYLAYSGSGAVLGCAVGVFAGSVIFPQIIWYAYCIMYNFSDQLVLTFDVSTISFILVSYTSLTLLVTWYCCRQSLKEVPAELIRPKAPTAGKQIFLELLPVWHKLKFLDKVAIRNIFRYRQRLAMMLLGIGGCTALLITGFGLSDSISDIVGFQFDSVMVYDIGVTFADPMNEEQQEDFCKEFRGSADQIMFCQQGGIDLEYNNSVKNMNFLAVEKPLDGFIDLHNSGKKLSTPGLNEAVISIGAASSMGIGVGDTVVIRNADLEEMELTVSGIFDNNVYNYVIITGQTMEKQWDQSAEMTSAFVVNGAQQDVHELAAQISKYDGVLSLTINQDTAEQVSGMMDALDAVVVLVVICAGLLAVIVLYNLTNINIKERVREIATIKVLGFNARETGAYVFKENLALTVMGTLLGLIGGKVLHTVVMSYVRIDMVWFNNRINWYSYILAAVLTLLAALIVDFIMYFQLEKINMAEALKSVE